MRQDFDPSRLPSPHAPLHVRLRWQTHEQIWRYTNGGTITGPTPAAYHEAMARQVMQDATPEPLSITVSGEPEPSEGNEASHPADVRL